MRMPKFITCREFLERKQKQKKYQNCLVRMLDRDEYEHMSFRLRENTDFDNFNNVVSNFLIHVCSLILLSLMKRESPYFYMVILSCKHVKASKGVKKCL